ncbi:MAG TPA: DUF3592 domain-containing protein [Bryobacteraceae bacterium]|nr:DUF3592 domain-containing protein [Bryobacteraceae bacterium]
MGAVFILVGLLLLGVWFMLRKKAQASLQWPSSRGRVISSDINRRQDNDGDWIEEARVVYEYMVGGASLQGHRIAFGGSGAGGARKSVERYPTGANVDVYYDPAKPASAVLERSAGGATFVLPLVGGVFAIVGIVLLVIR